jgi:hypothetical protein
LIKWPVEDPKDVGKRNRVVHDFSLSRVGAIDRTFPHFEPVQRHSAELRAFGGIDAVRNRTVAF